MPERPIIPIHSADSKTSGVGHPSPSPEGGSHATASPARGVGQRADASQGGAPAEGRRGGHGVGPLPDDSGSHQFPRPATTPHSPASPIPDPSNYVSITLEFRCNLRCEHCMIEGTMDWLEPQADRQFDDLLERNRRERRWKGLILTGSEITLRRDLPQLAERARAAGFERVRIQTHGMALAKHEFTERLVQAGVNEFFVSVPGADAAGHDAITGVPGSFDKTLAGLHELERHDGVWSITNTVVTARNVHRLEAVVQTLAPLKRLAQMEFWVYWPMREHDDKDLIAPHPEVLPHLQAAADQAMALGRTVEIKNFPHCLLGRHAPLLRNDQPPLLIDPRFWNEFGRNGFHRCVHRPRCQSTQCLGLNTAYTEKFGWMADTLRPVDARGQPFGP